MIRRMLKNYLLLRILLVIHVNLLVQEWGVLYQLLHLKIFIIIQV